jgi:hypothetical protein
MQRLRSIGREGFLCLAVHLVVQVILVSLGSQTPSSAFGGTECTGAHENQMMTTSARLGWCCSYDVVGPYSSLDYCTSWGDYKDRKFSADFVACAAYTFCNNADYNSGSADKFEQLYSAATAAVSLSSVMLVACIIAVIVPAAVIRKVVQAGILVGQIVVNALLITAMQTPGSDDSQVMCTDPGSLVCDSVFSTGLGDLMFYLFAFLFGVVVCWLSFAVPEKFGCCCFCMQHFAFRAEDHEDTGQSGGYNRREYEHEHEHIPREQVHVVQEVPPTDVLVEGRSNEKGVRQGNHSRDASTTNPMGKQVEV